VAVFEVCGAADATESAVVAVVGCFLVGHPEVADVAVVFAEADVAVDAAVGLAALAGEALSADDFGDLEAVDFVGLLFVLVVVECVCGEEGGETGGSAVSGTGCCGVDMGGRDIDGMRVLGAVLVV